MTPLQALVLGLEAIGQTFGVRVGTEQPSYRTLVHAPPVELREYAPRLVAETVVTGDAEQARNAGFRKVAAYIFGANQRSERVAMTSPVTQNRNETIAMTSPVVQAPNAGAWKIQFVMPAKYSLQTLPRPDDPDVRLAEEPAARYAVLRFSGSRSAKAVAARTETLMKEAAARGWRPKAEPVAWFYDPPWTVPLFRRNEVAVAVD